MLQSRDRESWRLQTIRGYQISAHNLCVSHCLCLDESRPIFSSSQVTSPEIIAAFSADSSARSGQRVVYCVRQYIRVERLFKVPDAPGPGTERPIMLSRIL